MKRLRLVLLGFALAATAAAAEWQWSVPMAAGRAYLWVPADCRRIRAVVVGQDNLLERGILEHAEFRRELATQGIAEVFITPPFDPVYQFDGGADERFDAMLRALAAASGYDELALAPVVPIGHSACASYPWNYAASHPGRTLAILSVKGDAPQTNLTGSGKPNPDWGRRQIDGIPALMVMSEAEWWEARLDPLVRFRAAHPATPIALLADVGHGHFDAFDSLVGSLARFLRKAARARLGDSDGTPAGLRPVSPESGWLVERWRPDAPPSAPPAPYGAYRGPRAEAFWCFDEEMARETEARYAAQRGKRIQQVDFALNGAPAPISNAHAGVELPFRPEGDGLTFRLEGGFIEPLPPTPRLAAKDTPPPTRVLHPKPARSADHAAQPVELAVVNGPAVLISPGRFRVAFDRATQLRSRRTLDIWLIAHQAGDATFKEAVQQGVLHLQPNEDGLEQRLTFAAIPDQPVGAVSVPLVAESSAGLPVSFYVREGPAEVAGTTLRITPLPPRAKLPVSVTVVAWQFGCAGDRKVRTAEPVIRTFHLVARPGQ